MINDEKVKKSFITEKLLRNTVITVLCAAIGVIIAFQYKTMKNNKTKVEPNTMTIEDYQEKIIQLSEELEILEAQKNELQKKVDTFETSTNEDRIKELERQAEMLRAFAGLTEVKAEGVIITLQFNDTSHVLGIDDLLHDLVNELKAAEAQAISVNGERLHAMSEIRIVNDTLVVNGSSFYSTFTFNVVGKAENIMSAIRMSGIQSSFDTFFSGGTGTFTMEYAPEVTVPAIREDLVQSIMGSLTPVN